MAGVVNLSDYAFTCHVTRFSLRHDRALASMLLEHDIRLWKASVVARPQACQHGDEQQP